ncbi:MAG TPA: hypothetical protein EYM42_14250, partial [Dehalococcoidia bacterium]|nr:hypothetical protein [Dehalococcoidia bacterium]
MQITPSLTLPLYGGELERGVPARASKSSINGISLTSRQGPPDIVLHNGKVLTAAADGVAHQALSVSGDSIQAVGSDRDMLALSGAGTEAIDLRGRTVIPGIIDIHAHMDREGLKRACPSLEGLRSIDDILAAIKRLVDQTSP